MGPTPHHCAWRCWCSHRPDSGRFGIFGCTRGRLLRIKTGPLDTRWREILRPVSRSRTETFSMKNPLFSIVFTAAIAFDAHAAGIQVLNGDAHFPEGPVWHRGKLYYVEYDRNTVTAWDGEKNAIFWSQKGCGPSAVVPTGRGDLITTCYDNGTIGRMSADGKTLPAYTHDKDGNPFVGPNDFAPDGHGGMYFTASGDPGPVINGKVFYMTADGTIAQKAG